MRTRAKVTVLAVVLVVALAAAASYAGLLGDLVKVGGVTLIVDKFGGQINDFVNKLTKNNNLGTNEATAVVPILSLGSGGYIGAAQIVGSKANVEKCKAILQIEGKARFGGTIRANALIPISARSTTNIKRINGVGVSAIIDIKI